MGVAGQIDQQVAQQTVNQPGLGGFLARLELAAHLLKGDLQFVQIVIARLVDPWRLAGRPDELAGEQVGQGRMPLPVGDQTAQQIGAPQEWAVFRAGAAQGDVVAAAGAGVAPVEHEFFRTQPRQPGLLVQYPGPLFQGIPTRGRMNVDFDDTGIGRDRQGMQARVARRRITLQTHRLPQFGRRGLDGGDQLQPGFQASQRRQEKMQQTVTDLQAQGGMNHCTGMRRLLDILVIDLWQRIGFIGQGRTGGERVFRPLQFEILRGHPRQAGQRQAQAHGRIAGQQVKPFVLQWPAAGFPAASWNGFQRQHVTDHAGQPGTQLPRQRQTLAGVIEIGGERVDIDRQPALLIECPPGVLVARKQVIGVQPQTTRQFPPESSGIDVLAGLMRYQFIVFPDRHAIRAPEHIQCPAWQGFAGIPFALTEMRNAAGRETVPQAFQQAVGQFPLLFAQRIGVPLRAIHVIDGDKGWFAALGETDIAFRQLPVDLVPQCLHGLPLRVRIGTGHARILMDAGDGHLHIQSGLAHRGHADDRRCRGGQRGHGQGDMPFSGQQTGCGIDANPAGAGYISFAPGMQIGEVGLGAGRAIQRFLVRGQLDQVAGDKAGGNTQLPQQLHQQPGAVPTGTGTLAQGLLATLDAGLQPDEVGNRPMDPGVQQDQQVRGGDPRRDRSPELVQPPGKQQAGRFTLQKGRQFQGQLVGIPERVMFGPILDKEIEGIDHGHVCQEIDGQVDFPGRFREGQARDKIAVGILLPMNEVLLRPDFQGIAGDRRAGVGGRPQADFMRRRDHGPVEAVMRLMMQGDAYRHGNPCPSWLQRVEFRPLTGT